jgi:hypothetical protein
MHWHIFDEIETIFPLGIHPDTKALEVSWVIGMLHASEREAWNVSTFGTVLPHCDSTWMEWQMDANGEIRSGSYVVKHDIPEAQHATAVADRYITNVVAQLSPGTGISILDFTEFVLDDLAVAPPAHHVVMVATYMMAAGAPPRATNGYFLYLDEKGAALEDYLIGIDLVNEHTTLESWHNCLPVLFTLNELRSQRWQTTEAYHQVAGIEVRKVRPSRIM